MVQLDLPQLQFEEQLLYEGWLHSIKGQLLFVMVRERRAIVLLNQGQLLFEGRFPIEEV